MDDLYSWTRFQTTVSASCSLFLQNIYFFLFSSADAMFQSLVISFLDEQNSPQIGLPASSFIIPKQLL